MVNFFVGYWVRDVYEATKIVVVGSLLFAGVTLGLLNVSYVYEAFHQPRQMLPEYLTIGYFILNIFLGIAASFVGSRCLPETTRELIETISG